MFEHLYIMHTIYFTMITSGDTVIQVSKWLLLKYFTNTLVSFNQGGMLVSHGQTSITGHYCLQAILPCKKIRGLATQD